MGSVIQRLKDCIPLQTRGRLKNKYLSKWYATSYSRRRCLARLEEVRRKPVVNVVFQIEDLAKWKCNSVLKAMCGDARFRACAWFVGRSTMSAEERAEGLQLARDFFSREHLPLVEYGSFADFPPEASPDIVFIVEPYFFILKEPSNEGLLDKLVCYVPYCFRNTGEAASYGGILPHAALFNFYENPHIASIGRKCMEGGGRNIIVTGHPIADAFMEEAAGKQAWPRAGARKRVIWAPHWTVGESDSYFTTSTFLQYADLMLSLARKYESDIQFCFKPHPMLFQRLCSLEGWGEERAAAYYRAWRDMPNAQYESGEYVDLFKQSDALIHDCGSFMVEYLFADKPCMYLLRESGALPALNRMSRDALECHCQGRTPGDIEGFLQEVVLGGSDPMRAKRDAYRREYLVPPNGLSAAQNIINAILPRE